MRPASLSKGALLHQAPALLSPHAMALSVQLARGVNQGQASEELLSLLSYGLEMVAEFNMKKH